MKSPTAWWNSTALKKNLQRAYRYSQLRRLRLWLKGKRVHWSLYLASTILLAGTFLGIQNYLSQFFYVVTLEGREVGLVRNAAEIENFLDELSECCSVFYGMTVEPEQEIALIREHRAGGVEDASGVKDVLRQQINLVTEAQMLTVDEAEAVAVKSETDVDAVIDLLSGAFTDEDNNVKTLEVCLLEEVACRPCCVSPEEVCDPEEVANLLLDEEAAIESRLLLASRHGKTLRDGELSGEDAAFPTVHVQTVEEVETAEKVAFSTKYTYNDKMWYVKSNVLISGKNGEKVVTYHVTRRNGVEISRKKVGEKVRLEPVTQVIEKGTSRVPSVGTGRFMWPVTGGTVTSGFRTAQRPGHDGVDIWHPRGKGTPILAADSGVVVETGSKYPQGNYIVIYHGSYYTVYLHNHATYVSPGAKVSRGQTIALMGNTGRTRGLTGVHLHFEVRRSDGTGVWGYWTKNPAVNPLGFFNP